MVLLGKSRKMASPLIASAHLLPDAKLWWLFLNCTIKGLDFTLLPLTDHRARTGAPRCWWQRHDCSLVYCLCKCLVRSRTKAGLVVMTGLWCLFRFEFTCTVCCFFFFLEWKWLFIWAKKHLILYISVTFLLRIKKPFANQLLQQNRRFAVVTNVTQKTSSLSHVLCDLLTELNKNLILLFSVLSKYQWLSTSSFYCSYINHRLSYVVELIKMKNGNQKLSIKSIFS